MREIYFDNNATTPLRPEVKAKIKDALDLYGNASSAHGMGRRVRGEIEGVRDNLRKFIGGERGSVVFTSGGSESNNLVLKGVTCEGILFSVQDAFPGRHIITSQVEHPSILETCRCLEKQGIQVTYIPVDNYGMVDPGTVEKAVTRSTSLISIMYANNEVGTIQPIKDIAAIAKKHGIFFHTDAVQAVGKLDVDAEELGVDFLSLSGHKLNGPKGIGALWFRKGLGICPLIHGGHQERSRRAGTENTLGIIGLGAALEAAQKDMEQERIKITELRDRLYEGLKEKVPDVQLNGHPEKRLPGTVNMTFRYIEGESMVYRFDSLGIAVSTGSACSTGSLEPSHVLKAMGLSHEDAHGSIRFSLGWGNTVEEVDYAIKVIPDAVANLREMSPLYQSS